MTAQTTKTDATYRAAPATPATPPGGTADSSLQELIEATLHMPFPFRASPHEDRAAAGVDAWLNRFGLTDDPLVADMIERTRPARLAAYNGPTMDIDVLQLMADQIAYQFVFDDRAEELGADGPERLLSMVVESIGILRDDQPPSTPLGSALADLYRRVQQRCTPAQAARWAWYSREYVHGLLYEAVVQGRAVPPRIGLCTSVRALIAGVEPFYPLCEAAQSRELTPQELHHPVMRRLGRLSADAAVWIPDLFSAVKEHRAGGVINIALAYQRAHGCSLARAVVLAAERINATIEEFQRLYRTIEPELSPAAVGYVDGMAGWIRGCYHWSRTVPRYADTGSAPGRP